MIVDQFLVNGKEVQSDACYSIYVYVIIFIVTVCLLCTWKMSAFCNSRRIKLTIIMIFINEIIHFC